MLSFGIYLYSKHLHKVSEYSNLQSGSRIHSDRPTFNTKKLTLYIKNIFFSTFFRICRIKLRFTREKVSYQLSFQRTESNASGEALLHDEVYYQGWDHDNHKPGKEHAVVGLVAGLH